MKMKVKELRKIIFEALAEAEEDAPAGGHPWHDLPDASFDVKLDDFFVDSETKSDQELGESVLRGLFEAEDQPDQGGGEEQQPPTGDAPDEEKKIDVNSFSREVARMIENFENLIDIKGVVLRRALNYVGQKYDKGQAKLVQDVLESQFGIYSEEKEEEPAPPADRAGPALAG